MVDSLQTELFSGTPDPSIRISMLVILGVVIAVMIALVYFRMKEVDEDAGIS